MAFRVVRSDKRITVTGFGFAGVLLLVGALALPTLLSRILTPEQAKQEIRDYLEMRASRRFMEELRARGLRVPDTEMALRREAESNDIKATEFLSVKVRRPLPDRLTLRPNTVAEVVMRDATGKVETRYFWLSRRFLHRETSRIAWILAF
jgi:hypothetical protein